MKIKQTFFYALLSLSIFFVLSACGIKVQYRYGDQQRQLSKNAESQTEYSYQKVHLDLSTMAIEDANLAHLNPSVFHMDNADEISEMTLNSFVLPERTKLTIVRDENCKAMTSMNLNDEDHEEIHHAPQIASDQLVIKAHTVVLRKKTNLKQLAQKLNANPCILEVSSATEVFPTALPLTNDPHVPRQKQLAAISADQGYRKLFPSQKPLQPVVVAVIDTGVDYTHEDLRTVMWKNTDGTFGYNFPGKSKNPMDDDGHGTHVAGLIGAQGNNNLGVRGVLPFNTQVMAIKVFPKSGPGTNADIINGIRWAADHGANVINLSLAGPGANSSMRSALVYAVNKGAIVFAAAGNAGVDIGKLFYFPAGYGKDIAGMITVGSFDSVYKDRSSFSNFSSTYVELSSPGSNGVHSTYLGNSYIDLQGTSMATPVAAGAAALAISYLKSKGKKMAPAALEKLIRDSAVSSQILAPFVAEGKALDISRMADMLMKDLNTLSTSFDFLDL